jgi:hypothetical protein
MSQILTGYLNWQDGDDTRYKALAFPAGYTAMITTDEDRNITVVPMACTISNLKIYTQNSSASPVDYSAVITLRKNKVDTALTVTVTEGDLGEGVEDTTHSVSFSAGDLISIKIVTEHFNGGYYSHIFEYSLKVVPTTSDECMMHGSCEFAREVLFTDLPIFGFSEDNSHSMKPIAPVDMTIKNLYAKVNTAPGTGENVILTLYKNGSPTSLTVTIAGTNTTANYATDISVSAGDELYFVMTSGSENPGYYSLSMGAKYIPSTSGRFVFQQTMVLDAASTSVKNCLSGKADSTVVSTYEPISWTGALTIKSLYLSLASSCSSLGIDSVTATLRKNGTDTSLTKTLTGATTSGNYATDITVGANDIMSVSYVGSAAVADNIAYITMVGQLEASKSAQIIIMM